MGLRGRLAAGSHLRRLARGNSKLDLDRRGWQTGGMKTYMLKGSAVLSMKEQDDRDIAALQGMCRGILADGVVNEAEAKTFRNWIERYHMESPVWPLSDIVERLDRIFEDGIADEEELAELKWVMECLCGMREAVDDPAVPAAAIALPIDSPPPALMFEGRAFVVTGNFAAAKRGKVLEWIKERGGIASDSAPTAQTDYLVIGSIPSKGWKHGAWGRKIEAGMELKSCGGKIAIIAEDHFLREIGRPAN